MHVDEQIRRLLLRVHRPGKELERFDDLVRVVVVEADVLGRLKHRLIEGAQRRELRVRAAVSRAVGNAQGVCKDRLAHRLVLELGVEHEEEACLVDDDIVGGVVLLLAAGGAQAARTHDGRGDASGRRRGGARRTGARRSRRRRSCTASGAPHAATAARHGGSAAGDGRGGTAVGRGVRGGGRAKEACRALIDCAEACADGAGFEQQRLRRARAPDQGGRGQEDLLGGKGEAGLALGDGHRARRREDRHELDERAQRAALGKGPLRLGVGTRHVSNELTDVASERVPLGRRARERRGARRQRGARPRERARVVRRRRVEHSGNDCDAVGGSEGGRRRGRMVKGAVAQDVARAVEDLGPKLGVVHELLVERERRHEVAHAGSVLEKGLQVGCSVAEQALDERDDEANRHALVAGGGAHGDGPTQLGRHVEELQQHSQRGELLAADGLQEHGVGAVAKVAQLVERRPSLRGGLVDDTVEHRLQALRVGRVQRRGGHAGGRAR